MVFLKAQNISKSFGGVHALKNVSIDIEQGHVHGLVGQNGCGKSTLMNIIAGVLDFDSGTLSIQDRNMPGNGYDVKRAQAEGVGIIYQDLSLFPNFTVLENIYVSLILQDNKKHWISGSQYKDAVTDILKVLGVNLDLDALVEDLPIAKQQLVAIARALINKSKLIILDEPTTALTGAEIANLFALLNKLKNDGISFIFISHKLNELLEICDEISVMRDGEVVAQCKKGEVNKEKLEELMLGHSLEMNQHVSFKQDEKVLELKSLSRRNCFADVNLTLNKGEVLGIAGQLGAGRTELAQALFGIEPAQQGTILLHGTEVTIKSIKDAIKNKIAYVPENRLLQGIVLDQSIFKNTLICNLNNYLNKLRFFNINRMQHDVDRILGDMRVKYDKGDDPIRSLSGGNQQKVVIAKWLTLSPEVLILDSPTVGIDVGAKSYIYEVIKERARNGTAIIVISDEAQELAAVADRILVMKNGRIVQEFLPPEIKTETLERAIY